MAYLRNGTCDRCGECCGYPRATDGGQNNPWPVDWPQSVREWTIATIEEYLPMFKITGHPNLGGKGYGAVKVSGNTIRWIWVPDHGLCTDTPPYGDVGSYDQRCPCLAAKRPDGTVPCLLYGTNWQIIYDTLCAPVPPMELDDAGLAYWQAHCPSCSYTWVPKG